MQKKFCWRAQTFSKICNNPPPFPPSPPAAFIHHHSDWHGLLGRYTQTMAFQKVFKATQHCLKLTAAMEKCIIDILRENENAEEETLLGNWLALSELQQSIACCESNPTHPLGTQQNLSHISSNSLVGCFSSLLLFLQCLV